MHCTNCGTMINAGAPCPKCGMGTSAMPDAMPEGVKGFSWGALLLNWIWAIGNRTWIGLLTLVPGLGFIMAIVLGFKGREWAWKNGQWESFEHFDRVQKSWSKWGVGLTIGFTLIYILIMATVGSNLDG